jgi:type IV secretion system protein VirD4
LIGLVGAGLEGKLKPDSKPGDHSIADIRSLIKSDDAIYNMAVILDKHPPSKLFHEEIATLLQTVEVTRSGILSTLTSHFRGLSGEGIERLLQTTSFDLQGFIDGSVPSTIYFLVPIEHFIAAEKLVRLVMGTLMTALYTRRRVTEAQTLVQLDEAALLGNFNPYRMGVTLFRGSSVIVHGLFQDIDQLITNYSDAKTIINNSSVIRLLGASNYWQATAMAELFGVSPRLLMNLEHDEQLLLIDGQAQRCRRVNYLNDELFAGRFDVNPRYLQAQPIDSSRIEQRSGNSARKS